MYVVARWVPQLAVAPYEWRGWLLLYNSRDVFPGDVVMDLVETPYGRSWVCSRTGRKIIVSERASDARDAKVPTDPAHQG